MVKCGLASVFGKWIENQFLVQRQVLRQLVVVDVRVLRLRRGSVAAVWSRSLLLLFLTESVAMSWDRPLHLDTHHEQIRRAVQSLAFALLNCFGGSLPSLLNFQQLREVVARLVCAFGLGSGRRRS